MMDETVKVMGSSGVLWTLGHIRALLFIYCSGIPVVDELHDEEETKILRDLCKLGFAYLNTSKPREPTHLGDVGK